MSLEKWTRKSFFRWSNINSSTVAAYLNYDWAGFNDTRRSTTVILITINGALVSWASKVQTMIGFSSVEAEYISLPSCAKEVIHLHRLFMELSINQPITNEQLNTKIYIYRQCIINFIGETPKNKWAKHPHRYQITTYQRDNPAKNNRSHLCQQK